MIYESLEKVASDYLGAETSAISLSSVASVRTSFPSTMICATHPTSPSIRRPPSLAGGPPQQPPDFFRMYLTRLIGCV